MASSDLSRSSYGAPTLRRQHGGIHPKCAGQYFDQEIGLFYNYFRDYDASVGRYVQSDPIELLGWINTTHMSMGTR